MTTDFRLESTREKTINQATAISILEDNNVFSSQRVVRRDKVKQYIAMFKEGIFRKAPIVFARSSVNGAMVLVDGQHRLQAVAESGIPLDVYVEIYDCAGDRGVAKLYATFNTDLPRTIVDISKVYGDLYNVSHWKPKTRSCVVSYSCCYQSKNILLPKLATTTLSDRSTLMVYHLEAGEFYNNMLIKHLGKGHNRAFANINVATCIMHSYEVYGKDAATEFWEIALSVGEMTEDYGYHSHNSPPRVLRKIYTNAMANRHKGWWSGSNNSKKRVMCLYQKAFEAFLKGKSCTTFVYKDTAIFQWEPGRSNRKKWKYFPSGKSKS